MLEGTCHCGKVSWRFDSEPESATACNCTACQRYGGLWIYGMAGEDVHVTGETVQYVRSDGGVLSFDFCGTCGCVVSWTGRQPDKDGRRPQAVNVRMAKFETVQHLPIEHFDGLHTFEDLGQDGKTVKDMWF